VNNYLKEIIDQIIEIDSLAFENKTRNEQALLSKKQEYQDKISGYRNKRLSEAKNKAESISAETDNFISENEKSNEEQLRSISASIKSAYSKAEKGLIKKIFNKLFVLEG